MRKKDYPVVNVGTASILVIFIILTLVTFATLSLLSANTHYRFSAQTASNTTAYYQACNQAQSKLALIDQQLGQMHLSSGNPAEELAREGITQEDGRISFSIPTREGFALYVELAVTKPEDNQGSDYRITRWQEQATTPWQGDNTMQLLE